MKISRSWIYLFSTGTLQTSISPRQLICLRITSVIRICFGIHKNCESAFESEKSLGFATLIRMIANFCFLLTTHPNMP
jgi:hypothetical protein